MTGPAASSRSSFRQSYSDAPTMQTIVRRGSPGDVRAYCDRAGRVLETTLVVSPPNAGKKFVTRTVTIKADEKQNGIQRFPLGLLDLRRMGCQVAVLQLTEKVPELALADDSSPPRDRVDVRVRQQIKEAIEKKYNFPVKPKGLTHKCTRIQDNKKIDIHFQINIPMGVNPASMNFLKVRGQVLDQLRVAGCKETIIVDPRFNQNYKTTDTVFIVEKLLENLEYALNEQYQNRAIEEHFLPDYLAELNPNRTESENRCIAHELVRKVVDEIDSRDAIGVLIYDAICALRNDMVRERLRMTLDYPLASSEARPFLDDVTTALNNELATYDPESKNPQSRSERLRLVKALEKVRTVRSEDIMLAPHIDSDTKLNRLIDILVEVSPGLTAPEARTGEIPFATVVSDQGAEDVPVAPPA